jgi:exodeoxyribonuclease VII large subunit
MQHTLLEVNQFLRRVIVANLPEPLWVTCEIMQISTTRGHYYIDLVEKDAVTQQVVAQAQAVLWSGAYYRLKQKIGANLKDLLQVGVQALIRVRVDFSERYGLKLVVEDLDPAYTLGQMLLQRQQTILTLQKDGLLALNKTRPLPLLPQRLAIISSATAAGLQDFLQELTQNKYGYPFQYQLFTAAMQGQFTEKEVVHALERIAEQRTAFDAVAILRGGGSKLDLSAFDSLKMCKAIANFPLPVLTGIGHDIDEAVADLVAHTTLKTPTAVATFLVERCLTAEMSLRELSDAIRQGAQRHLTQQQQRLEAQNNGCSKVRF